MKLKDVFFLSFHIFYLLSSTSTAIKSYFITLLFSQLFFYYFSIFPLFSQGGPWATSPANSIVFSSLECKLFLGKKWIFCLCVDHKVMNNGLMLQNISKTEDKKLIYSHKSFKLHHHKLQVKKSMLPNTTGFNNSFTTWHIIPHLSAKGTNNGNLTNNINKKA